MSAVVRKLQPADVPRLLELIAGLADYEKLARPDAASRERLAADAAANPPRFSTLLAEVNGQVVGYAIYFFTYSTFETRPTLYLEDLFVVPEARRLGAGRGLLAALANAYRIGALGPAETARRRNAIAVERDLVTERLAFLVGHTQEA